MSNITTPCGTYTKVGTDVKIIKVLAASAVAFASAAASAIIDLADLDYPEHLLLEASFTPGSGGTLDVTPSVAETSGGTYYTLLDPDGSTTGAIPQMTTAVIATREITTPPGYRFVKVTWDVGTADSTVAINLIGYKPRYSV